MFFQLLKAVLVALVVCALGLVFLSWWATPNPKDIALVPMAWDAQNKKGAGFMVNATEEPWLAYVVITNRTTAKKQVNKIWMTTNRLQTVSYDTPAMVSTDIVEAQLVYAKKLVPPESTMLHAEPLFSVPSP